MPRALVSNKMASDRIAVTPTAIDPLAKTLICDWSLVASAQQPSGEKNDAQQNVEDVIVLPKLERTRQHFP